MFRFIKDLKFEYLTISLMAPKGGIFDAKDPTVEWRQEYVNEFYIESMKRLGNIGWELISVTEDKQDSLRNELLFKRSSNSKHFNSDLNSWSSKNAPDKHKVIKLKLERESKEWQDWWRRSFEER